MQVAGLEVFDRQSREFIPVETKYKHITHAVVLLGEKANLFAGSQKFMATPHRVVSVRGGKDKVSTNEIYLVDSF